MFRCRFPAQNFLYNVSELVAGNEPAGVIFEDFNRDDRIDLAVANYGDNTVSIFMGTSGTKFAPKVNYATGAEPTGLIAADLRGTGKLDIVTVNIGFGGVDAPGSVSVLLVGIGIAFLLEWLYGKRPAP